MKITELQIGNWVSYCKEPFQVDYLHRTTDTIGLKYNGKNHNFQDGAICAEDATPIPLTTEILEKNLVVKNKRYDISDNTIFYTYDKKLPNGGYSVIFLDDGTVRVNCFSVEDEGKGYYSNINLYCHPYVHELQRALICCGLWDLADNFKV